MSAERERLIEERLRAHLTVTDLEIVDNSHLHAGHAGARAGGGHYAVAVVSPDFEGRSRLQRQRLVYQALGDAMRADTIHALEFIRVQTPAEAGG